jgi:NAD(P)-dependent dehydrogenase (short-subunit alcohol dehydrogenase family)
VLVRSDSDRACRDAIPLDGKAAVRSLDERLSAPGEGRGHLYAVAKHGILGLTRTAAVEYATDGVRVNAVAPGLVDTPLTARMWDVIAPEERDGAERELLATIPAGRMAGADEVAAAIAWLCTEAPPYLTGATLVIDGGLRG